MKKLTTLVLTLTILLSCIKLNAQAPDTLWTRMFLSTGGVMNGDVVSSFAKQTSDGGFISCGYTLHPLLKTFIFKTDGSGKKLWQSEFFDNPTVKGTMTITTAAETNDGGYILAGHGLIPNKGNGIFLFRIKSNGDTLWSKFYDHTFDNIILVGEVKVTPDNGFVIVGTVSPVSSPMESDIYIMKTDSEGRLLWQKIYGQKGYSEKGFSVVSAYGGGYIVSGSTNQDEPNAVIVLKIDENSNEIWNKHYVNFPDIIYPIEHNRIIRTMDDKYAIGGTEGGDFVLMKIEQDGEIIKHITYSKDNVEQANAICESGDGGFLLAGYAYTEWPKNSGEGQDFPLIVKFDSEGQFKWEILFYNEYQGEFYSVNQNKDNGYICGGSQKDKNDQNELYLVRLKGDYVSVLENNPTPISLTISPNPIETNCTINYKLLNPGFISIKMVDNLGRENMTLVDSYSPAGSFYINIENLNLSNGTYYCRFQQGEKIEIRQIAIIR